MVILVMNTMMMTYNNADDDDEDDDASRVNTLYDLPVHTQLQISKRQGKTSS